jgi:hypothetical protein
VTQQCSIGDARFTIITIHHWTLILFQFQFHIIYKNSSQQFQRGRIMHACFVVVLGFKSIVKKMLAVYLALCLSVIPALSKDKADVIPPGNWGVLESLMPGTKISVRMTFGDRIDGKFLGLNAQSIRLTMDEKERIYPRSDVAEVWQLRAPDRKLNGTLIGMGSGAAAGIIATYAVDTGGGDRWTQEDAPGPYLLLAGFGLGALVGAIIDASIKGDKRLYRAQ